jgi:hypothetical protein
MRTAGKCALITCALVVVFSSACWSQTFRGQNRDERDQCQCVIPSQNGAQQHNDAISLSPEKMKAHVVRIAPIPRPANMEPRDRFIGVVELNVQFDSLGNPTCAKVISGNAFIYRAALSAITQSKFKPVSDAKGKKHGGCGRMRIAYRLTDTENSSFLK